MHSKTDIKNRVGRVILTPLVACFFVLTFVNNLFSGPPDEKLHKNCLYPTMGIRAGQSFGTGFVVRSEKDKDLYRNIIVTCFHVITDGDIKILIPKYVNWSEMKSVEIRSAKIYSLDLKNDLAVLMFYSSEKINEVEFGFEEQLHMGDSVTTFGCAGGDAPALKEGKISNLKAKLFDCDLVKTSIFTAEGDSGSGVFHNYKVVGIMRAIKGTQDERGIQSKLHGISFFTPIRDIKNWSEQDVDFIYKREERIPWMPFYEIQVDFISKRTRILPSNRWIK